MKEHPYLPVPPGLVDDVAKRCHETMCETTDVITTDGRGTAWDGIGEQVQDVWRAVARQAIGATLNRMIHEGWLVVRPSNIQEK